MTADAVQPSRVLFIFLDGVGLGSDDPARNAMADHMPRLTSWLGAPPTRSAAGHHVPGRALLALDATLGMEGTPQSGTGQATLLTGENAARLHGRHFGPWVPTRLQPLVRERSILAVARAAGESIAFANAYPEHAVRSASLEDGEVPRFMRAGPPLAALGAGVLNRHAEALREGDAVATEIVNDGWRGRLNRSDVPAIDEAEAARNLIRIARRYRLTLFAHYTTDAAGHRRDIDAARAAIARVDRFLGALLEALPTDLVIVIASDHGNVEDCTQGHTRNPAFGVVAGSTVPPRRPMPETLCDIAPFTLGILKESGMQAPPSIRNE